jgi:BlaR1 peptidase M56
LKRCKLKIKNNTIMLTYFLQVNLCWLMFYGLYYALLSRETFFKLNRIYLIISLLCGLVIPFSIPTVAVTTTSPMVEIVQPIVISMVEIRDNIETNFTTPEAATWTLWTVLKGVYILGMMLLFVKFFIGLNKIFHLYKTGEKEIRDIFKLIKTPKIKSPFSFFNLIFINQKTTEDVDYQQIIEHEKAHVIQKHSFDIVGLEILRGLFWLSPLVHLYARSLRNVHEYLADAAVLQNTEKQQYGRLLISQTTAGSGLVIANHLNFSQLKKRIIMMTRNESQRLMLVKYTLALPLFALLVFAFTLPNNPLMKNTEGVAEKVENVVQSVDNQLFKKNNKRPEITIKGTERGWVLPQNLYKVTALDINEGFEILKFKMLVQDGDGMIPTETYYNTGSIFSKELIERIRRSKPRSYFHFVDISIKDLKRNDTYLYGDSYLHIVNEIPTKKLDFIRKDMTQTTGNVFDKNTNDDKPYVCLAINSKEPKTSGFIKLDLFQANNGLLLKNNLNWTYKINQFYVYKVSGGKNSNLILNKQSGVFNEEVEQLIKSAKNGDRFYFHDILVDKKGEINPINLGTLTFYIGEDKPLDIVRFPIPNPSVKLANTKTMPRDLFAKMTQLDLQQPDYKTPITCAIQSFIVLRKPYGQPQDSIQQANNIALKFRTDMLNLVQKAQKGDVYEFRTIKVRCPGDIAARALDGFSITITE